MPHPIQYGLIFVFEEVCLIVYACVWVGGVVVGRPEKVARFPSPCSKCLWKALLALWMLGIPILGLQFMQHAFLTYESSL